MSGSCLEAHPNIRELSGDTLGCLEVVGDTPGFLGVVGKTSRMSGSGREALPEVQK